MSSQKCLNVGLFTISNPQSHGGLEVYVRGIARCLESQGAMVTINGQAPNLLASLEDHWKPRVNQLLPLMTRPSLRFLARLVAKWNSREWAEQAVMDCDIVHFVGTGWDLLGFALVRATEKYGKKITCLPAVHPSTWGDSPLDIDFYKRVDVVFALSDYEAHHLAMLGVPPDKFTRCGCAPSSQSTGNAQRFREKHKVADKKIVLFVGRKTTGKGYHALRHSIAKLAGERPDIVLVSIGKDSAPPYPSLPVSIDIDLGATDESTKQDALAACDIFALPSEAESFGIVYVEAWSYGKPVITGKAPASREMVLRHNAGLTTDNTPDDIKEKINTLLSNPEVARQMGRNGLMAFRQNYTLEKIVETHCATWNSIKSKR